MGSRESATACSRLRLTLGEDEDEDDDGEEEGDGDGHDLKVMKTMRIICHSLPQATNINFSVINSCSELFVDKHLCPGSACQAFPNVEG